MSENEIGTVAVIAAMIVAFLLSLYFDAKANRAPSRKVAARRGS